MKKIYEEPTMVVTDIEDIVTDELDGVSNGSDIII